MVLIPYRPHPVCIDIARDVQLAGGRAVIVGGWVRDALLGIDSKDVDMEVYGLPAERLESLLKSRYRIDSVGRAFAVYKLKGLPIDVSLPRRESKAGTGHRGFIVEGDPSMTPLEAAKRRDFTLNAISWDPLSGEVIDPVEGLADLQSRKLRHVSERFREDPLRVLRGMQFCARFLLSPTAETLQLCREIQPENLPKERIFEEWKKLILRGTQPSLGLNFLRQTGWVQYYPELTALIDCPQDPIWHPEGDVWTHTMHCMDAFAERRTGDPHEDLVVGLAVLCHDFGKPSTTHTAEDGRIRSPGHEIAGLAPAESFLLRLTNQKNIIEEVLPLVETHMRPNALYKTNAGDAAVRRLSRITGGLERLLRVVIADTAGRPPLSPDSECATWLRARAEALAVKDAAPSPILQGRHLIERGMQPGSHFAPILKACYEAQLDGAFDSLSGAMHYLDTHLDCSSNIPRISD